jgi:hypothetical protein
LVKTKRKNLINLKKTKAMGIIPKMKKEPGTRTTTRTTKRGNVMAVKTKSKTILPGGGKVKTRKTVISGPGQTITKERVKIKGAEDIQGKKEKTKKYSIQGMNSSTFKSSYKSKGDGRTIKKKLKDTYPGPTL